MTGRTVVRNDGVQKATGAARYGADIRLPGMLYGKLLCSPYPHARVLNIDTRKAERVAGVKAAVTAADTPKVGFGYGPFRKDKQIFAIDKVRFFGDEIAAVAAVDEDVAEEALELIEVEYEPLPAIFDPEEAIKPDAPRVHEDLDGNLVDHCIISRGDVKEGFNQAHVALEETFRTQRQHQCYLEPLACLAHMDLSGRLTIYGPFHAIFTMRAELSKTLGIPEDKIRAIQMYVGGSFGVCAKGSDHISLWAAACLLARKSGRPVMMQANREEAFITGRPRVPAIIKIKLGATRDGRLVAKESHILADAGAYTGLTPFIIDTMAHRPDNMYRLTNVKNEASLVLTNNVPAGAIRGFGNPQMTFALESMIDMIAESLSIDPMEIRLRNATQPGDTTVHGWQPKSCALTDCIKLAAEASGWKEKNQAESPNRGIGMACMTHVSGRRASPGFYGSRALIKITEDGKVNLISGEGEVGQGWFTVAAAIAAQEMGLPMEEINVIPPDTDVAPFCFGPYSDRTTILGGNAVRLAAADAKRKLLEVAGEMMEANPVDLEMAGGRIFVKGSADKGLTLQEAARWAMERPGGRTIWGMADYDPPSVIPDPESKYGNVSTSYTFACQAVEVKVNVETGQVSLLNFVAAHDLGRAIFPLGAEGQIEGAASQGIGFGLMEEMKLEVGIPLNPNLLDYRIPTSLDVPDVRPILVESNDPFGPFGAKGVGEPGLVPTVAALANAIYNAIGVRITSLPITPEKVLAALQKSYILDSGKIPRQRDTLYRR